MTRAPAAARGFVVVTGTSTGIGRACAQALARAGFRVIAGVRKESDGERLVSETPGSVTPIILDVCDAEHRAEATRTVEEIVGDSGLAGIVNNAGIGIAAPVECVRLDELRRQFEVNVFALVAVVQALLPLIRRGRGRIVNIGSVGSWITMPFGGPLCASKFAVRSLNDALRMELKASGVPVVLVEPGAINTPSVDKLEEEAEPTIDTFGVEGRKWYAQGYRSMIARAVELDREGVHPDVVGRVVLRALLSERPRTRYTAGPRSRQLHLMGRFLPNPVIDRVLLKALGIPNG